MSLMNMIVSAIIKKGVLYEARNCDIECDIPIEASERTEMNIKVHLKIEHMTLRFDKGEA